MDASLVLGIATHVAGVIAALTLPALSQVPPQPVFTSGVELVALTATVLREDGSHAAGLDAADFRIREEGVEQQIALFGGPDVPLDLVLMLDTSDSMHERLPLAQHAALRVIDALDARDTAAVVGFGNRIEVSQRFTSDKRLLRRAIRRLRADGDTPLYTSVYVGLGEFARERRHGALRRRALVVLSDGEDTGSLVSFDAVIERAKRLGVAIYTVISPPPFRPARWERQRREAEYEMRAFARDTGARAFFLGQDAELEGTYRRIAEELAHQYVLGYVSNRHPPPGTFTRVTVTVGVPGLSVRVRAGYVAGH